jgi:hypothetical protein
MTGRKKRTNERKPYRNREPTIAGEDTGKELTGRKNQENARELGKNLNQRSSISNAGGT